MKKPTKQLVIEGVPENGKEENRKLARYTNLYMIQKKKCRSFYGNCKFSIQLKRARIERKGDKSFQNCSATPSSLVEVNFDINYYDKTTENYLWLFHEMSLQMLIERSIIYYMDV